MEELVGNELSVLTLEVWSAKIKEDEQRNQQTFEKERRQYAVKRKAKREHMRGM